jgi:hypothetical protein
MSCPLSWIGFRSRPTFIDGVRPVGPDIKWPNSPGGFLFFLQRYIITKDRVSQVVNLTVNWPGSQGLECFLAQRGCVKTVPRVRFLAK